jgi:hypothetical protein
VDPDPDPGGPKTCGSGSGFGSGTLLESIPRPIAGLKFPTLTIAQAAIDMLTRHRDQHVAYVSAHLALLAFLKEHQVHDFLLLERFLRQ